MGKSEYDVLVYKKKKKKKYGPDVKNGNKKPFLFSFDA